MSIFDKLDIHVKYYCLYRDTDTLQTSNSSFEVDITDDLSGDALIEIKRQLAGDENLFAFEADSINLEVIDIDKSKYYAMSIDQYMGNWGHYIDYHVPYPIAGSTLQEIGPLAPWRGELFTIIIGGVLRYVGICMSGDSPIVYDEETSLLSFTIYDPIILMKKLLMGRLGYRGRELDNTYDAGWWGETITDFVKNKYPFAYRHRYQGEEDRFYGDVAGYPEFTDEENEATGLVRSPAIVLLDEGDIRFKYESGINWVDVVTKVQYEKKYLFSSFGVNANPFESEPDCPEIYERVYSNGTYHGDTGNTLPVLYSRWEKTPPVAANIIGENGIIREVTRQLNGWCPFFTINAAFPANSFDPPSIKVSGKMESSGVLKTAHIFQTTLEGRERYFIASFDAWSNDEEVCYQRYALHEIINGVDLVEILSGDFPAFGAAGEVGSHCKIRLGDRVFDWGTGTTEVADRGDSFEMMGYDQDHPLEYHTRGYWGHGTRNAFVGTDVIVGVYVSNLGDAIGVFRRSCRRYKFSDTTLRYAHDSGEFGYTYRRDDDNVAIPFNAKMGHNIIQLAAWSSRTGRRSGFHRYDRYVCAGEVPAAVHGQRAEPPVWTANYGDWIENPDLTDRYFPWYKFRLESANLETGWNTLMRGGMENLVNRRWNDDNWNADLDYVVLGADNVVFKGDVTFNTIAVQYEDATAGQVLADIAKLTNSVVKLVHRSPFVADLYVVKRSYFIDTVTFSEDAVVSIRETFSRAFEHGELNISQSVVNNKYYSDALSKFYADRFATGIVKEYEIELVSSELDGVAFDMIWKVIISGKDYGIIQLIDWGEDTTLVVTRMYIEVEE